MKTAPTAEPCKQFVRNLHQKIKTELFSNPPPGLNGCTSQFGGIPSVRLYLLLEEPLHTARMLSRTAVLKQLTNFRGDGCRGTFACAHGGYCAEALLFVFTLLS